MNQKWLKYNSHIFLILIKNLGWNCEKKYYWIPWIKFINTINFPYYINFHRPKTILFDWIYKAIVDFNRELLLCEYIYILIFLLHQFQFFWLQNKNLVKAKLLLLWDSKTNHAEFKYYGKAYFLKQRSQI